MEDVQPMIVSQFIVWIDEKISEFKVQGFMNLDTEPGAPKWIKDYSMSMLVAGLAPYGSFGATNVQDSDESASPPVESESPNVNNNFIKDPERVNRRKNSRSNNVRKRTLHDSINSIISNNEIKREPNDNEDYVLDNEGAISHANLNTRLRPPHVNITSTPSYPTDVLSPEEGEVVDNAVPEFGLGINRTTTSITSRLKQSPRGADSSSSLIQLSKKLRLSSSSRGPPQLKPAPSIRRQQPSSQSVFPSNEPEPVSTDETTTVLDNATTTDDKPWSADDSSAPPNLISADDKSPTSDHGIDLTMEVNGNSSQYAMMCNNDYSMADEDDSDLPDDRKAMLADSDMKQFSYDAYSGDDGVVLINDEETESPSTSYAGMDESQVSPDQLWQSEGSSGTPQDATSSTTPTTSSSSSRRKTSIGSLNLTNKDLKAYNVASPNLTPKDIKPYLASQSSKDLKPFLSYQYGSASVFPCVFCGFSAVDTESLRHHLYTHVDKRQLFLQCPMCRSILRHAGDFTRHIISHFGAVFQCHLCSKKFNRKDNLSAHLKKRHQVKL